MADVHDEAELSNMRAHQTNVEAQSAALTPCDANARTGDATDEQKYLCVDCNKLYASKRSLTRHLSNKDSACVKLRRTEEEAADDQSKFKWHCSRCKRDYVSVASVDRHIDNACWKTCDGCAADGATRCDSATKDGPCRNCEAAERACTKHTAPVTGSKPLRSDISVVRSQPEASTVRSASPVPVRKRKTTASPVAGPAGAPKSKRAATSSEVVAAPDMGRVVDPLGRPPTVPLQVKNAAVSEWLQDQSNKSVFGPATRDEQKKSEMFHLLHLDAARVQQRSLQLEQSDNSPHVLEQALPAPPTILQSHPILFPPYKVPTHGRSGNPPPPPGFSQPPPSGPLPRYAASPRMQLDHDTVEASAFNNEQERRQAAQVDLARRFTMNNGTGKVPQAEQDMAEPRVVDVADTPNNALQYGPLLHLRIHTNTFDKNGDPIFSILRIRYNERFGPHLNAYCAQRGKTYGFDWIFVYRFTVAVPEDPRQKRYFALSWDMTPADVHAPNFPGVTMRHMDTIYVVQTRGRCKPPNPDAIMLSRAIFDIANGETTIFQHPDVNRMYYAALDRDHKLLRAACSTMRNRLHEQQQQLKANDAELKRKDQALRDLVTLSQQLRNERQVELPVHGRDPPPPYEVPHHNHHNQHGTVPRPENYRVERQRPVPFEQIAHPQQQLVLPSANLAMHPAEQRPTHHSPSAFVAQCEAVRDPTGSSPHLQPLQFPVPMNGLQPLGLGSNLDRQGECSEQDEQDGSESPDDTDTVETQNSVDGVNGMDGMDGMDLIEDQYLFD